MKCAINIQSVRSNVGRRWRPSKARSLLGYARYDDVLASSCRAAASELSARAPPSVLRIFIESGCVDAISVDAPMRAPLRAYALRSSTGIMACRTLGTMHDVESSRIVCLYFHADAFTGSNLLDSKPADKARKEHHACIVLRRYVDVVLDGNVVFSESGNFVGTVRKAKPPPWMSSRRRCKR